MLNNFSHDSKNPISSNDYGKIDEIRLNGNVSVRNILKQKFQENRDTSQLLLEILRTLEFYTVIAVIY